MVGVTPLQLRWQIGDADLVRFLQPVLASERVRYVGEPIALVIAENLYLAEDAAEKVQVEIDPLPAVTDPVAGMFATGGSLFEKGNQVAEISKRWGDVEVAFAAAPHRMTLDLGTGRQAGVPMETRGCLAHYEPGRRRMWIWGPLNPTAHRRPLAEQLGMPESSLHLEQGDIGGNFGSRAGVYPEDVAVPYASRLLGRPVKWIEDRAEHLVATSHGREQHHHIEAAFDADGRVLAIRDEIWHDIGAYVRPQGLITSDISAGLLCAPYRVPAYDATLHVVATNKTPICPYRGPGRFEGSFVRERLLDVAARRLGLDPLEIRRRNLLSSEELPFAPGIEIVNEPFVLADMDVPSALEKAVDAADYEGWRQQTSEQREFGRVVGTGIAVSVDKSGLGGHETGAISIDGTGHVRVVTGGFSVGQGIETVMAQIAADELGVDPGEIEVTYGDSELDAHGVGSFSSRSTALGGSAVLLAARATAERAREVAAELLEADPRDIVLAHGSAHISGAEERGVSLAELARACDAPTSAARGWDPGLGAKRVYVADAMNHPYAVTLAQVEIEPETGDVTIRRLFVAGEVGRAINPMTVEGQIVGAAAQGVGGSVLEELRYDQDGQPLTTTLMDYLIPTATSLPKIAVLVLEDAPTATNPLGAMGVGELGGLGCGAAIANAIEDALGTDAAITRTPVGPALINRLCRAQGLTKHESRRSSER